MHARTGYGVRRKTAAIALAWAMGMASAAQGGPIYWNHWQDLAGEWSNTNNWNLLRLPSIAAGDEAYITYKRTANVRTIGAEASTVYVGSYLGGGRLLVGSGADAYFPNLRIATPTDASSELIMSGGTLTCNTLAMLEHGGPGLVLVTGGVFRVLAAGNAVQITHPTAYTYTGPQILALGGTGRMEMVNGTASEIKVGSRPGAVARLHLSGDAVLTNLYRMTLGHSNNGGFGVVTISNNAVLQMNNNLYIGGDWDDDTDAEYGGTGIVTVAGGVLRAYDIHVGRYGTGELRMEGGNVLDVHDMVLAGSRGFGAVHQTGGTVDVERLYLSYVTTPSNCVYNLGGGTLRVRGALQRLALQNYAFTITGGAFSFYRWMAAAANAAGMPTLTNAGGTMSPGLALAGITKIETDYVETSSGSRISIDVGGTTQATAFTNAPGHYDHVNVSGSVALMGELQVNVIDGFAESARSTDKFYVLSSGGGIAGAFANVASGERVTTPDGHTFLVYYGDNAATTEAGVDPKKVTLTGFHHFPRGTVMLVR